MLNKIKALKSKILGKYDTSKVTNILHEKSYARTLDLFVENLPTKLYATWNVLLTPSLIIVALTSFGYTSKLKSLIQIPSTDIFKLTLALTTVSHMLLDIIVILSYIICYPTLIILFTLYTLKVIRKDFSLMFLTLFVNFDRLSKKSYMQPLKGLNYVEHPTNLFHLITISEYPITDRPTLLIIGNDKYREKVKKWLETK